MSTENPYFKPEKLDFVPILTTTDWNDEWMRLQKARLASDNAAFWDKKAETYNKPFGHSPYSRQFLEYTGIESGDSVFDMGCGTGALAIPLSVEGHDVCAADFSEGMLGHLKTDAQKANARTIEIVKLSWEDDWEAHGIEPKSFDVAVASRSIATSNIKEALMKLSNVARKRCAITLSAGSSPRSDQQILQEIGLQPLIGRDFLYAFMVLIKEGFMPEVRYIVSERRDSYKDEQDAFDSLKKMVLDVSYIVPDKEIDSALVKLDAWVKDNLVENPHAGKINEREELEEKYIFKEPRKIIWAHISWEVQQS